MRTRFVESARYLKPAFPNSNLTRSEHQSLGFSQPLFFSSFILIHRYLNTNQTLIEPTLERVVVQENVKPLDLDIPVGSSQVREDVTRLLVYSPYQGTQFSCCLARFQPSTIHQLPKTFPWICRDGSERSVPSWAAFSHSSPDCLQSV